jgi:transcriptional antiterminator RfaH
MTKGGSMVEIDPSRSMTDQELVAWFCLSTQPKHEHIAAARLRQLEALEVFCPRIRFRRNTKRGAVWFSEALFPGYIFARFDFQACFRQVRSSPGVRGIVHFGEKYPVIEADVVDEVRHHVSDGETILSPALTVGDSVTVAGGMFHGLSSVVHQLLPARERVCVLLEFLGRTTTVELHVSRVVPKHTHPLLH